MKRTLFLLLAGVLCWTSAQAEIHTVDANGSATANGAALTAALEAAQSGDIIKLKKDGIYQGTFTMKEGVNVIGGWESFDDAEPTGKSTLDANSEGRVVTQSAAFSTLTVWSNLTITRGSASDNHGGGAVLLGNGRLENCIIQNNKTTNSKMGGGVHLNGGQLYNCIVRNNTSDGNGGGVRIWNASTMINCLVADNTANATCGGIYIQNQLAKIIHCTIVNNNQTKSSPTNEEKTYCGVRCDVSTAANQSFVNNVIWGNKVNGSVGGQQMNNKIVNYNTRTGNAFHGTVPTNYNSGDNQQVSLNSDNTHATQGPFFKDPSNADVSKRDYSMTYQSKLIDQKTYVADAGSTDLAGNKRLVNANVDLGCYEFQLTKTNKKVYAGDEHLQDSIDITFPGYSVKVQAGTFIGNFTMREGVNVSGGWEDFNDAAPTGMTILDANHSGRPLTQNGEFNTETTWSNFTLTGGNMDGDGGGAYLQTNGALLNCKIQTNTATNAGGVCLHGKGKLLNCLVAGNTATNANGGVSVESALSDVINNTIVNNNQLVGKGSQAGVKIQNNLTTNGTFFVNNVVWGNMSNGSVESQQVYYISRYSKDDGQRSYNAIQGQLGDDSSETSQNFSDATPGFKDAEHGDFTLLHSSVLIDFGNNAKATEEKDIAGNKRIVNSKVDLGCYEFQLTKTNKKVYAGDEHLQDSIDITFPGYSVKVQAGTFIGNFTMREGVNVSGGWEDFNDAAPTGMTILDANHSGRPLTQNGEFNTETTWSNFTLTGGNMDGDGGGAYLQTNGALLNCKIQTNTATNAGGVCLHGKGKLVNCLVADNTATNENGGVTIESALSDVINNTIVNNNQLGTTGSKAGVKIQNDLTTNGTFFVNNVVWGNMSNGAAESSQVYYISRYDKSAGQRSYNAIQGQLGDDSSETSQNFSDATPGFKDAEHGDFTLLHSSVLIDFGNNAKATEEKDIAGNKRIVNSKVDLGCYESQLTKTNKKVYAGDEHLQDSIDVTFPGYEVKVQAGTFTGNFTMREGVNVSGGWNSTFDAQTDYATILDANNSGRVLTQPDVFSTPTVWRNFTIQHGSVAGNGGGALLQANGKLEHCTITHNVATASAETDGDGGGVYCDDVEAGLIMDDCILSYNSAVRGGGARIRGQIQNSIIEHNEASNNAGGLYLLFATATNCHIQNNSAPSAGGVRIFGGTATDCEITSNTATTGNTGGAYVCVGGKLLNSKVMNNSTGSGDVGGVRVNYFEDDETGESSSCRVANCLIANNSATATVGGLYMQQGEHQIYNNTIVDNTQGSSENADRCGARINTSDALVFANNIVWGNKVGEAVQANQVNFNGGYDKTNCKNNALVLSSSAGTNTILLSESPFADADYHLIPFSDLINSGDNDHNTGSGSKDLDGNPRKQGSIDRGCYERTKVSRDVAEGQIWGTICMPFAITSDAIDGATMYKVLSFATNEKKGILLEQVDNMAAGMPYFFHVNENATTLQWGYVRAGDAAAHDHENGLYGTIAAGTVIEGADYYVLQGTELHPVTNGAITMPANRAYLKLSEVPDAPAVPSSSPRRRVMGIHNDQGTATGIEETNHKSKIINQKLLIDGHLFIIRDGKTYNTQGQLVK